MRGLGGLYVWCCRINLIEIFLISKVAVEIEKMIEIGEIAI